MEKNYPIILPAKSLNDLIDDNWILTDDLLPETNVEVEVAFWVGSMSPHIEIKISSLNRLDRFKGEYDWNKVIAWRYI